MNIKNPFIGMSATEISIVIGKGRVHFLSKDALEMHFERLPRFKEVFESAESRLGVKKAAGTAHAALLFSNHSGIAYALTESISAPNEVAVSLSFGLLDFIIYQAGIDPQEFFAFLQVLGSDTRDLLTGATQGE